MSEVLTAEEFVQETESQEQQSNFKMGVVVGLFTNGTAKITFDGEESASEKEYSYLASYAPKVGDRVLLASVSGKYVILGKIKYLESPEGEKTDFDTITIKTGSIDTLTVNNSAQFKGTVSFSQGITVPNIASNGNITSTGLATLKGGAAISGNIGFFGTSPTSKRTCYYASSDTYNRQRLNELIQVLAYYGLINASN